MRQRRSKTSKGSRDAPLALEDVALVTPAVGAHDLDALHPPRAVDVLLDGTGNGVEEGGPAATGLELRDGHEQRPSQRGGTTRVGWEESAPSCRRCRGACHSLRTRTLPVWTPCRVSSCPTGRFAGSAPTRLYGGRSCDGLSRLVQRGGRTLPAKCWSYSPVPARSVPCSRRTCDSRTGWMRSATLLEKGEGRGGRRAHPELFGRELCAPLSLG